MKILINDTISIHPEHASNWLEWLQSIVIPMIKKEPVIESFKLTKIRGNEDENGITFALQFICLNQNGFNEFIQNFDPKLQQEQLNRFRGQFGSFRSVLEIIDEA